MHANMQQKTGKYAAKYALKIALNQPNVREKNPKKLTKTSFMRNLNMRISGDKCVETLQIVVTFNNDMVA